MKVRFVVLLLVLLYSIGFGSGLMVVTTQIEPTIVYVEKIVEVEKIVAAEPIIKYIEVPTKEVIIKEVYIIREKIVYKHITDKRWETVNEFIEWYHAQNFYPLIQVGDTVTDCDDYAERLQIVALRQGYPVSVALARKGIYYGKQFTSSSIEAHAANMVEIGGVYYWVEPEPDKFYVRRIVNRD